jgi:hypothetical protein
MFSANLTYVGGTIGTNGTNYDFTVYSLTVPSDQNYSVNVIFANPNGENATISAGFFPLFDVINGTAYVFVQCALSDSNSSSPIVCQINKNLSS